MSYLTLESALQFTIQTVSQGRLGRAALQATVEDSRPFLFVKHVGLTLDWGDGSLVERVDQQLSPYTTSFEHAFKPGTYTVKLKARNYQLPVPETVLKTYDVKVPGALRDQLATDPSLQPIIYGPILPREQFPNPQEWRWHVAQDTVLLESSVRLLLITAKGERLMNPNYGTRIREFIFTQSDATLRDALTQEVRTAISSFEPRVDVTDVAVQVGSKKVTLAVKLTSKLDQRPFQVTTSVVKT